MTDKISRTQWFYLQNKENMDSLLELLDSEEETVLSAEDDKKGNKLLNNEGCKKIKEIKNKLLNDNEILFDVISKIVTAEKNRFEMVTRKKMLSYTNMNKFSGRLFEYWENNIQLKLEFDLGEIGDGFGDAPALLINFMIWTKDEEFLQNLNERLSAIYQSENFENSMIYDRERHNKAVDEYFQNKSFEEEEEYFGDDNLLYAEFELKEGLPYEDIEEFVCNFMDKYINAYWTQIQDILKSANLLRIK